MKNFNKVLYIGCTLFIGSSLIGCNSGSSSQSSSDTSTLSEWKNSLNYTPIDAINGSSITPQSGTQQHSFMVPTNGLTILNVKITLFNTSNCKYNTNTQTVQLNGGNGVFFQAGTYGSNNNSNYNLQSLFQSANVTGALSMRVDYQYASQNDGPGWVSAPCIENTSIMNYDSAPVLCTSNSSCGFSNPQTITTTLPTKYMSYVILSSAGYNGNLLGAATNLGAKNLTNGYDGANYLCNIDAGIPSTAKGSNWKALLSNNNATISGTSYYNTANQLVAVANGSNLRGYGALSNLNNVISSTSANVWTGFTPDMNSSYTGWTITYYNGALKNACNHWSNSTTSDFGNVGASSTTWVQTTHDYGLTGSMAWGRTTALTCNNNFKLYCVQQP